MSYIHHNLSTCFPAFSSTSLIPLLNYSVHSGTDFLKSFRQTLALLGKKMDIFDSIGVIRLVSVSCFYLRHSANLSGLVEVLVKQD